MGIRVFLAQRSHDSPFEKELCDGILASSCDARTHAMCPGLFEEFWNVWTSWGVPSLQCLVLGLRVATTGGCHFSFSQLLGPFCPSMASLSSGKARRRQSVLPASRFTNVCGSPNGFGRIGIPRNGHSLAPWEANHKTAPNLSRILGNPSLRWLLLTESCILGAYFVMDTNNRRSLKLCDQEPQLFLRKENMGKSTCSSGKCVTVCP